MGIDELRARNFNLDIKNPHHPEEESHDPQELLAHYTALQAQIQQTRDELKAVLAACLSADTAALDLPAGRQGGKA